MTGKGTATSAGALWPNVPYESWSDTLATLHRFAQVVGKVRLAASVRRNHWWNVPFHLTGRGITTRPMGEAPIFAVDFDFLDHRVDIVTDTGPRFSFPLPGHSVATFAAELTRGLESVGVHVDVPRPRPFDLPDAGRPFAEDTEHAAYDPIAVTRYWRLLARVNLLLEEFAGRWSGKTSPVHHFWHTFDIAVTRFADVPVQQPPSADAVTREAYSREVISFGFWFGDASFPEPAFYSYTAPEPPGLAQQPLRPGSARWVERRSSHLAVLTYADARATADPRATALGFFDSAFEAGAGLAGWDRSLDCPGGITDPVAGGPPTNHRHQGCRATAPQPGSATGSRR
jgi:Family of unknown function (DUF5996)